MIADEQTAGILREVRFTEDDYYEGDRMLEKLDVLIQAWGRELLIKRYIDEIPGSEQAWLDILERKIHWDDLNDQWDHYLVSCLLFFVPLRSDIGKTFLLEPDNIRGQKLNHWLWRARKYLTPLSRDVITEFCLCYCMILEKKTIKVRYQEFKG